MAIRMVRRKNLLNAGLKNADLIHLFQRADFFKNLREEKSIYLEFDVLMIFIALNLLEFLPMGNISLVIRDLAKFHHNLYRLLKQNPRQFLVVEKKTDEVIQKSGIEFSYYVVYPELMDSLKVLNWEDRKAMILLNLQEIYLKIEDLFSKEGTVIATDELGQ
jgi:hypothetical protein